jgi:two-component system, chemotaxis family, chemotaxis protein CheY
MKRCLIVDDSRVIRRVANRIVEDLGFKAEEAVDGANALAATQVSMPDVVLLDWDMPNLSGLEYLIALRKLPKGDIPKVVFCATENDVEHIQQALDAGADEYIMKPFDSQIVRAKFDIIGVLD